jgi:hypothetical protein
LGLLGQEAEGGQNSQEEVDETWTDHRVPHREPASAQSVPAFTDVE